MEEDKKKKKKNKNKKAKQATKQKESVTLDGSVSISNNQDHVPDLGHDNDVQASGVINVSNNVGRDTDIDRHRQLANGSEGASVQDRMEELQTEKDAQMQNEAILEEKIKQLLKEKDEILQKGAAQEEIIKQLHNEANESMLQETSLKEKILHLEKEKDELIRKETIQEHRNKQLKRENEAHLQKEARLEVKIVQLEGEKDFWLQKEAALEEKINNLMDEAAVLNLKAVSLQEKIKQTEGERDSWILRENSAKESITSQNNENIKLQAQIEAARALVEKLCAENSKLVEKVNELHAELDQRVVRREDSLPIGSATRDVGTQPADIAYNLALPPTLAVSDDDNRIEAADTIIEVSTMMMPLSSSDLSLKDVVIEDEKNGEHLNDKSAFGVANTSEIIEEVDEIVQISLDEHQVTETNLMGAEIDEKSDIRLTDAPLIGAPFRLISFVARYVSGADLVK